MRRRFRIPFRVPFRGLTHRSGVVFEGDRGWAEFSPFPWYSADEVEPWERAAREAASTTWPEPRRASVPVNTIVPEVTAEAARELVLASGCTTAKVKVGDDGDEARVEAARDALGPNGRLRIDANASWDLETAEHKIKVLDRYDLEYVEQPVESLEDLAELRRRIEVPLAVDEPARSLDGVEEAARKEVADVLIVKVQPIGGVLAGMRAAEMWDGPVVVSSAVETSIGLAAGLALAAALPELPYACGLGTLTLLAGDLVADPLVPTDGAIVVRRPPLDNEAMRRWEVTS